MTQVDSLHLLGSIFQGQTRLSLYNTLCLIVSNALCSKNVKPGDKNMWKNKPQTFILRLYLA